MIRFIYSLIRKLNRRIYFFRNNVYVAPGSFIDPSVEIGCNTRINAVSHIGKCKIGAYCAIGGRLVVRSSNHHTQYLNMQDWAQRNIIKSSVKVAGKQKGEVVIGNAVWIGDSVIILPGVNVGDGSVIGAGSVLTKNIPPYSIAVGNPAKVIKKRFDTDIIILLEKIKWWEWSTSQISDRRDLFEMDLTKISQHNLRLMLNRFGIN